MNSLLQCCRQLLFRLPTHLLPQSQECPLARALQPEPFSQNDVKQWPCWTFLPLGPQRDACEVLEMCLDPTSPLHNSCDHTVCYGALLQNLTAHNIERHLQCKHCAYVDEQVQKQCILRVDPQTNVQTSILASLQEVPISSFKCEHCGLMGARQQTILDNLPPVLVVHVNKPEVDACLPAEHHLRLSGTDLQRFAAVHHTGETTTNGHYTATVATQASVFHCDDSTVSEQAHLSIDAWPNAFLILYQNNAAAIFQPAPRTLRIDGDEDSGSSDDPQVLEDDSIPSQEFPLASDMRIGRTTHRCKAIVLEPCGDPHPAQQPALATTPTKSGDPHILQDASMTSPELPLASDMPIGGTTHRCKAIVLEQCGDPHPAQQPALTTTPTKSSDPHILQDASMTSPEFPLVSDVPIGGTTRKCEESSDEQEDDEDEDDREPDEHCKLEASEIHVTTSRHDDWLHRGSLLADLPWLVYMMRVQRVRKPTSATADYSELFFFDAHYPLSILYCQEIQYCRSLAIPRIVGSVCPPLEEDGGEPHARYKLMLFSRTRCPGRLGCADPMICRASLLPSDAPDNPKIAEAKARMLKSEAKPSAPSSSSKQTPNQEHALVQAPKFLPCWKACKCEIEMKAHIAITKEHLARKIAVIADTTTMKDCRGDSHPSATRRAFSLRPLILRHILAPQFDKHICQSPHGLVQLVGLILSFECGWSCYHPSEQLHLIEFAALQMKKYNDALDIDILVRKKPFREEKQGGFVNDVDSENENNNADKTRVHSEFLGGGGESDCDEQEDTEGDLTIRRQALNKKSLQECKAVLSRSNEVERANAPGRTKEADAQIKNYVLTFQSVLQKSLVPPPSDNTPRKPSLLLHNAANFQNAQAKELRTQQPNDTETNTEIDLDDLLQLQARNKAKDNEQCVNMPLDEVLRGPGHVAWKLIQGVKEDPDNNFEFNEEQIDCIALQIWPLEQAWRMQLEGKQRPCTTVHTLRKLPNDLGLPRILIIGGGGCGKTTLMQVVVVPTLQTFFSKIVLSAPSNRAARGFHPDAKTIHSIASIRPQDSMRTSTLSIKGDQMRKRMDANQTHAGAWVHDEALQTSAPLLHAAALRSTYVRQHKYNLDIARYAEPSQTMGKISFFAMCGDHLQLPPVPKSSGLLASLENTSDEHKVGASIFNQMHYLFEMHTMKRFEDATLIAILEKMRKPGGAKLSQTEWQALLNTELDAEQVERDPDAFLRDTAGWFESCYLWSIVSMASYMRAMISARKTQQILFYCQAVDFSAQIAGRRKEDLAIYDRMLAVPSVALTKRLPGWVMLHLQMRVRLTTQVLPPWAVQDSTGTVMEMDLSGRDRQRLNSSDDSHLAAELVLEELPHGVYVKLDKCNREFLPTLKCQKHAACGFCKECSACRSFEGWILVQPMSRQWSFTDPVTGFAFQVQRTQLPLMPESACPLYSLQGATCDPGLLAHFIMPKRADEDIRWLIVYVMLSRVRSLSRLRSIGLTLKIRKIIEGGPPTMLAANFERLFRKKIKDTSKAAKAARAALGWQ